MILDDGGDMTLLVHYGLRAEQGDVAFLDKPTNEEEEVFFALIKDADDEAGLVRQAGRHQGRLRGDHHGRAPPLR